MKYLLQFLGYIFAKLPECVVDGLCKGVGWLIYAFPSRRVLVGFSNVHHCFPNLSRTERNKIVYESCRRMVEMALFVVASPYLTKENLRGRIKISDFLLDELKRNSENPQPYVLMIPHFAMMESITMLPILVDFKLPPTGVFYRPFDNAGIESWVHESRERCGLELVSRKGGIIGAIDFLRKNGCLAMLFDQNAARPGALTPFFGRICSTSELSGIFVERQKSKCGIFYARRTGFWRSEIFAEHLAGTDVEKITLGANAWLEKKLNEDEIARYDWLWLHRRWRVETSPAAQLVVPTRKSLVDAWLADNSLSALPRARRIFVTAPESLSDTIALLPVLRQIRASAYDASITLICDYRNSQYLSSIGMNSAFDSILSAPSNGDGALAGIGFYKKLREHYPDIHIVLQDSLLADFESFTMAAPMRFAVETNRRRRFMTYVYKPDFAQSSEHVEVGFEAFARALGMCGKVDFAPIKNSALKDKISESINIGIVCGGAGAHAWSGENWSGFIKILDKKLPSANFSFYGGGDDARTAFEVTKNLEEVDAKNCTSLSESEMVKSLAQSDIVVGADSPLLHVANALGIKVAAIFGITNPIRNGFVFEAEHIEIQPRGCPPQGGADVNGVNPKDAAEAVAKILLKF